MYPTHALLLLNTILELAVPAAMLANPAFFYRRLQPANLPFARLFACALAGLGATSLILLVHPAGGLENGLIALAVMHGLVASGQAAAWRSGISQPFIAVVHAVLCLAFIVAAA